MDTTAATPLVRKIATTKEELQAALITPEFYVEWTGIALALVIAWLLAKLVQRRTRIYLENHPPKRIDAEFITKPMALLGPLLALVYLGVARPFAEHYAAGGNWIDAVTQLCLAYLAAKCVVLIVGARPISYFISLVILIIAVLDVTGFMKSTSSYLGAMAFEIGTFKLSMLNLIHGIVILVIVFWIAGLLSRTLESYLRRSSGLSYNARELIVKFFKILVYFVAILITLSAVGVDLTAFAVFGGALGVGIGLGLQKLTANFFSGITLLVEKSVKLGDLIEVAGVTGWVRALNIRYALVETFDGRELMIPNEELISTRVTNWTHSNDLARIEIRICIPFTADAVRARELMLQAASEHKRCLKRPEATCQLREFGDHGMIFFLNFWIPDIKEGRLATQSDVMFAVLEKFRTAGIPMAEAKTLLPSMGDVI